MKSRILLATAISTLLGATVLGLNPLGAATAPARAGGRCSAAGRTTTVNGVRLTCVRSSRGLVWQRAAGATAGSTRPATTVARPAPGTPSGTAGGAGAAAAGPVWNGPGSAPVNGLAPISALGLTTPRTPSAVPPGTRRPSTPGARPRTTTPPAPTTPAGGTEPSNLSVITANEAVLVISGSAGAATFTGGSCGVYRNRILIEFGTAATTAVDTTSIAPGAPFSVPEPPLSAGPFADVNVDTTLEGLHPDQPFDGHLINWRTASGGRFAFRYASATSDLYYPAVAGTVAGMIIDPDGHELGDGLATFTCQPAPTTIGGDAPRDFVNTQCLVFDDHVQALGGRAGEDAFVFNVARGVPSGSIAPAGATWRRQGVVYRSTTASAVYNADGFSLTIAGEAAGPDGRTFPFEAIVNCLRG